MNTAHGAIDKVLAEQKLASAEAPKKAAEDKFYSVLPADGIEEYFLELQFQTGMRCCFAYGDLDWFNFDPDAGCIDLDFGGYLITIKGRGLYPKLFEGIKKKRVAWVKEADTDMQDHKENPCYIEQITISPPTDGEAPKEK